LFQSESQNALQYDNEKIHSVRRPISYKLGTST
jgi:hypothetical protein